MARRVRASWGAVAQWLGAVLVTAAFVGGAAPAQAFVWPSVPERIARGLASTDVLERRAAAAELPSLPREVGAPIALGALADEDTEVRVLVARVVARLGLTEAGDRVVPWLSDPESRVRLAACEVIRAAPSDRASVALGRVLSDPNQDVRIAAARALGRSRAPEAASLLLGHLDDAAIEVRVAVSESLGRLGDPRAVLPLLGKVQDGAPEVRRKVARALGDLGDARAVSALVLALSDGTPEVRVEAARALGRIGSDEATVALAPVAGVGQPTDASRGAPPATETSHAARRAALDALGRIGSPRALDLLVGALAADRPDALRTPAADALVAVGPRAVTPLRAALGRAPSERAAIASAQALARLGDPQSVPSIVAAMQRGALPTLDALDALETLGADAALPAVLELVDAPAADVRRAALRVASALLDPSRPDGRPVEPAQLALADASLAPDERVALVTLLGRTGSPRAEATLVALAGSPDVGLRRASLVALGHLSAGSPRTDRVLVAALDDDRAEIRHDAAVALGRVGTPAVATDAVERLLAGAEVDRGALGLAVSGLLERSRDAALAARVGEAVTAAPLSSRDALVEGLGRMPTPAARAQLERLARGPLDDRRKVAEALGGQGPEALAALAGLVRDPDAGVRANAAWSIGEAADARGAPFLVAALRDADVAVAGNAAAALGRLGARLGDPELAAPLAGALDDRRVHVVANALAGLRLAAAPVDEVRVVTLLTREGPEEVRAAAAAWLHGRTTDTARRALARCAADDPTFDVARRCASPRGPVSGAFPLVVFVVPDGLSGPEPRAPFALVLSDGRFRLGTTDRRGVVFERAAPGGDVELGVPAALIEASR